MNDAPDRMANPVGLDFVIFSVSGWRVAFEARQVRSCSIALEGGLGNGIEARLGFSPAAPKAYATPRQCLRIKCADDDTKGETKIVVDGPVDLVCLPVAAIYPLPPLLTARTRLHGLRALALEPETVTRQITLLFNSACLTDGLEKERDDLEKDADALSHNQKDDAADGG